MGREQRRRPHRHACVRFLRCPSTRLLTNTVPARTPRVPHQGPLNAFLALEPRLLPPAAPPLFVAQSPSSSSVTKLVFGTQMASSASRRRLSKKLKDSPLPRSLPRTAKTGALSNTPTCAFAPLLLPKILLKLPSIGRKPTPRSFTFSDPSLRRCALARFTILQRGSSLMLPLFRLVKSKSKRRSPPKPRRPNAESAKPDTCGGKSGSWSAGLCGTRLCLCCRGICTLW